MKIKEQSLKDIDEVDRKLALHLSLNVQDRPNTPPLLLTLCHIIIITELELLALAFLSLHATPGANGYRALEFGN